MYLVTLLRSAGAFMVPSMAHGAICLAAAFAAQALSIPSVRIFLSVSTLERLSGKCVSVLCVPVCERLAPPRSGMPGMPGRRCQLGGVAETGQLAQAR